MKRKMMAHPKPGLRNMAHPTRRTRITRHTPLILALAIVAVALILNVMGVPSASAGGGSSVKSWTEVVHTPKGNCTLHFQEYAPGAKSVEDLLGPSYATVWTNQSKIPSTGPYQGMRGQDPWPGEERKAFVNLREEVHLFWAGGTFVSSTPRTTYCRDNLLARYKNDSRSAVSRFTVEQVGLGLYNTDLR